MNRSNWFWSSMAIVGLITTIVFVSGFVYATNQILYPQAQTQQLNQVPEPTQEPIANHSTSTQIIALGDSLTAGTGDLTGLGYVGHVRQKLEEQSGQPVYILNNLAIPGYRTEQVLQELSNQRTRDALAEAELILLSIGGNDLFLGGMGIFVEEKPDEFNAAVIVERTPAALRSVEQILTEIRASNASATIVYVGLYNPYLPLDTKKTGSLAIQSWNAEVFKIINRFDNVFLVPTYDIFVKEQDRFLAADDFHPNGDGYERIADRIVQILK